MEELVYRTMSVIHDFSSKQDDDECPPSGGTKKYWSCEQYETFQKLSTALTINNYVTKGIQVFIFILLLTKISIHRCQRRGQIGGLQIFIACLSLL